MYVLETPDEAPESPAWIPLRRVFKQAYLSELVRASTEELPDTPDADLRAIWRSGDRGRYISVIRALEGKEALKELWVLRSTSALLDADLPAEALDVLLTGGRDVGEFRGKLALLAASVLLRLGSVSEAGRALDACAAGPADDAELQQLALLRGALAATTPQGRPASWPDAKALMTSLLELRLPELAASVLSAFLEGAAELADDVIDPIAEHCFTILRTARAWAALRLLAALDPLFRAAGAHDAYREALIELESGEVGSHPPVQGRHGESLSVCLAAVLATMGHWRAAARRFVMPSRSIAGPFSQVMCELARVVGQDVISTVSPRISTSAEKPKIIDVFPFNGELDVLELKMDATAGWVDRFIIVEASRTFTGLPKPLIFPGAAERFARHRDKIIYQPLDDFPSHLTSAWAREFHQRDQGLHALAGLCAADDIVLISDADELVDLEAIQAFQGMVGGADLRTICYFLNFERIAEDPSVKTVMTTWRIAARTGLSRLRIGVRMHMKSAVLRNAGWHFTNIGSAEDLVRKYTSISHEEWAHLDRSFYETMLQRLKSQGGMEGYRKLDIEVLPEVVRSRREALAHLILP